MIVVIAWQIVGWWLVVMCLRRSPVAVGGGEP
jgi:hypothetical protein